MADLLADPRELVAGAREEIEAFKREWDTFFDQCPYRLVYERDPKTPEWWIAKIQFTQDFPKSLDRKARAVAQDLRSALDQAGYACAQAWGQGTPPFKRAVFPIADNLAKLDDYLRTRCKQLPPDILAYFKSLDPYKGGNDSLWALHEMTNTQKHRFIVPHARPRAGAFGMIFYFGVIGKGRPISHDIKRGWNSEKNEIELFKIHETASVFHQTDIAVSVRFGDIEVFSDQDVITVLTGLAAAVDGILDGTEAVARQIGLIP